MASVPTPLWRWLVGNGYRACHDCGIWFKAKSARNTRCPSCSAWYAAHAQSVRHGLVQCSFCGRYTTDPSGMHARCAKLARGVLVR